jgi:hypothetical protein
MSHIWILGYVLPDTDLKLMEDLGYWSEVHETNIKLHLDGVSDELHTHKQN